MSVDRTATTVAPLPPHYAHPSATMMNLLSSKTLRTSLVLVLAASSAAAQSLMGLHGELVLAAGQAAPGLAGYTLYDTNATGYGAPVIDQNGTIVQGVRLLPAGVNDRAIYVGRNASDMQLVAQSNQKAPGLPVGTLLVSDSLTSGSGLETAPIISPFNEIIVFGSRVYDASIPTPTDQDSALFWGPVGGTQLLALEGDQIPGLAPGSVYGPLSVSYQTTKINSSGLTVFQNEIAGAAATADAVLLAGFPGAVNVIAREGEQVPGQAAGVLWSGTGGTMSFLVAVNDAGDIVFNPKLIGTGVTSNDDSVLATYQNGAGVTIWGREGDQAPGMAPGVNLYGSPSANSSNFDHNGNLVFWWRVYDGGVTVNLNNDEVVWTGSVGGMTALFREGDSTGLPGGVTFGAINSASLSCNSSGTLAFIAGLRDAAGIPLPFNDDSAMFIGTPANWTELCREGQVIHEIPASIHGPWVCRTVTAPPSLNNRGQLLFRQSCTDGFDILTHWLCYTPGLGLQVVQNASETYTTTLGSGTATAGVSTAGTQGNGDNGALSFNHAGDFAFRQDLDNGLNLAIVRGHCGNLYGTPASIDGPAGGKQTFTINGGAAGANSLYAILGSGSGTRPGTVLPSFGALNIPLNFDAWTDASLSFANSPIYINTLWVADPSGNANASFNLPAGLGLGSLLLHHAVIGLDLSLMETFVSEPVSVKIH